MSVLGVWVEGHVADLVTGLFLPDQLSSHVLASGPEMWRLTLLLVCFRLSQHSSLPLFLLFGWVIALIERQSRQKYDDKGDGADNEWWWHWRWHRWLNRGFLLLMIQIQIQMTQMIEQGLLAAGGIHCGKIFQLFQQLQASSRFSLFSLHPKTSYCFLVSSRFERLHFSGQQSKVWQVCEAISCDRRGGGKEQPNLTRNRKCWNS